MGVVFVESFDKVMEGYVIAREMEVLDVFLFHTIRKRVFKCLNIARFSS